MKTGRFLRRGAKIIDRKTNKVHQCLSAQAAIDLLPVLESHFAPKPKTPRE
jgi:hypothetical protein